MLREVRTCFEKKSSLASGAMIGIFAEALAACTNTNAGALNLGPAATEIERQCLRWIARQSDERRARWSRVLDYGCGSGILAIGAALHGAGPIDAVDIDDAAVQATVANAAANGVTLSAGRPDAAQGAYPLVLANILATPLKLLAPLLAGHVAAGGHLVLAGILERQADELKAAYAPWLSLEVSDQEDGWILMTATRPTGADPGTGMA